MQKLACFPSGRLQLAVIDGKVAIVWLGDIDVTRSKRTAAGWPYEWANLLHTHDEALARVRMLWRRGGGAYRPLVPVDVVVDRLQTDDEWDDLELEESHFPWIPDSSMDPAERRDAIEAIVDDLWQHAVNWTRTRGEWCDFQLHGFNSDGHALFEQGRRCHLSKQSQESADSDAGPSRDRDAAEPKAGRRELDWRIDRRLDELLDRLAEERDKSATNARDSLDAAKEAIEATPQLFKQAREVLCETIDYQRQQFEQLRGQSNGRYEAQARVLGEMEETKRTQEVVGLFRHMWDSFVGTAVPLADRFAEVFSNRNISVFPEFRYAQQALAYMVLTLTPHQLNVMWPGKTTGQENIMQLFDEASKMTDEREALKHCGQLARVVFSGDAFRSVATPEQQLAGRFIIGRLALFRLVEQDDHGA